MNLSNQRCRRSTGVALSLGTVIGTALGWGNAATIALAVVLASFFGYSFTMIGSSPGALKFPRSQPRIALRPQWPGLTCARRNSRVIFDLCQLLAPSI
jgi:predicted MFS family arabinose efflux permease